MMKTRFFYLIIVSLVICGCGSSKKTQVSKKVYPKKTEYTAVDHARSLLNSPYKFGGTTPRGFDCSGFVWYVYDKSGYNLPRRSADQAKCGYPIKLNEAKPGDLIFFKSGSRINHVGIVMSTRGKYPSMIHASSTQGIVESDLDTEAFWRKRFAFIRRL